VTEPAPPHTPTPAPPVTDRRVPPRGVVPRHLQTWLMAGLAAGILGIIVFTGHTDRPQRTPASGSAQPVAPDAARLRDYQERLRLLDERARQQVAEPAEADERTEPRPEARSSAPDPIAAERRRRNYESLFADVMVLTKRPAAQQLARVGGRSTINAMPAEAGAAVNNIDALADLLSRATVPSAGGSRSEPRVVQEPIDAGATAPPTSAKDGPRVRQGSLIPVTLVNRIDSTSPGPVICQVIEPVLSEDAQHVLIPAGARLLGNSQLAQGQDARVAIVMHTMQIGHADCALDRLVALNDAGEAGLRARSITTIGRHSAAPP